MIYFPLVQISVPFICISSLLPFTTFTFFLYIIVRTSPFTPSPVIFIITSKHKPIHHSPRKVVGIEQDAEVHEGLQVPDERCHEQYSAHARVAEVTATRTKETFET